MTVGAAGEHINGSVGAATTDVESGEPRRCWLFRVPSVIDMLHTPAYGIATFAEMGDGVKLPKIVVVKRVPGIKPVAFTLMSEKDSLERLLIGTFLISRRSTWIIRATPAVECVCAETEEEAEEEEEEMEMEMDER
jgi:hypothetical protein